jgi:hypothetical protein
VAYTLQQYCCLQQTAANCPTVCVALAGIEKLLQRSAGYDVQQLLSGSKPSLSALTSAFSDCPGWMMGSVEPAAATAADRQAAAAALADAVKVSSGTSHVTFYVM